MYNFPNEIMQIKNTCELNNLDFKLIDEHSGYLCQITKGNKKIELGVNFISSYPINGATANAIASDKAFCKMILSLSGIKVAKGDVFFISGQYSQLRNSGKSIQDALIFAKNEIGYPIIAKPNNGAKGNFVQKIFNDDDLKEHLHAMATKYYATLIEEVIIGTEYRVFVIDNNVRFAYKKMPVPKEYSNVNEFISEFEEQNIKRKKLGLNEINKNSESFKSMMKIVQQKRVLYPDTLNIYSGNALVTDFTVKIPSEIKKLSLEISNSLKLRVFAYDFIAHEEKLKSISKYSDCCVIDVNSNPMLRSLETIGQTELIYDIWKEVIDKSFKAI